MDYLEIFKGYNFLSLDISVRSTGWCKYKNGVFTFGSFGLESKDELHRRMEFRGKIKELVDNDELDFIAIEDVIGGNNFETVKYLIQLNSIVDDMIYMGEIPKTEVRRIGNTIWKKHLKTVTNYSNARMLFNKDEIRSSINTLGFTVDTVQDVYDSIGIAIGAILNNGVIKEKKAKIRTDLSRSYKFYKYSADKVKELCSKYDLQSHEVDITKGQRDMLSAFKSVASEIGDNYIFILNAPLSEYGVLALTGKLPMLNDDNRVIAIKKTLK